jgi:hypothetical protein
VDPDHLGGIQLLRGDFLMQRLSSGTGRFHLGGMFPLAHLIPNGFAGRGNQLTDSPLGFNFCACGFREVIGLYGQLFAELALA